MTKSKTIGPRKGSRKVAPTSNTERYYGSSDPIGGIQARGLASKRGTPQTRVVADKSAKKTGKRKKPA